MKSYNIFQKIKLKIKIANPLGLYNFYKNYFGKKEIAGWFKKGKPIPPPHAVKQEIVKDIAQKSKLKIFIETGTFLGDMVNAVKNSFEKIYSIEINEKLYQMSKKRFKKYNHIHIIKGDSGEILKFLLQKINEPVLFWLDAHYSGGITGKGEKETPIIKELQNILNHQVKNHIILIDDARLFVGKNDFPIIEELKGILNNQPYYRLTIKDDIIRIFPFKKK